MYDSDFGEIAGTRGHRWTHGKGYNSFSCEFTNEVDGSDFLGESRK